MTCHILSLRGFQNLIVVFGLPFGITRVAVACDQKVPCKPETFVTSGCAL